MLEARKFNEARLATMTRYAVAGGPLPEVARQAIRTRKRADNFVRLAVEVAIGRAAPELRLLVIERMQGGGDASFGDVAEHFFERFGQPADIPLLESCAATLRATAETRGELLPRIDLEAVAALLRLHARLGPP